MLRGSVPLGDGGGGTCSAVSHGAGAVMTRRHVLDPSVSQPPALSHRICSDDRPCTPTTHTLAHTSSLCQHHAALARGPTAAAKSPLCRRRPPEQPPVSAVTYGRRPCSRQPRLASPQQLPPPSSHNEHQRAATRPMRRMPRPPPSFRPVPAACLAVATVAARLPHSPPTETPRRRLRIGAAPAQGRVRAGRYLRSDGADGPGTPFVSLPPPPPPNTNQHTSPSASPPNPSPSPDSNAKPARGASSSRAAVPRERAAARARRAEAHLRSLRPDRPARPCDSANASRQRHAPRPAPTGRQNIRP